jgi:hypothetical protein
MSHLDDAAPDPGVHLDQIRQRLGVAETVDRVPGPMGDPLDAPILRSRSPMCPRCREVGMPRFHERRVCDGIT